MFQLKEFLDSLFKKAFEDTGFLYLKNSIVESKQPIVYSFQCNSLFYTSKHSGETPENIANKVIEYIKNNYSNIVDKIYFAKPGFINFSLISEYLSETLLVLQNEHMDVDGPKQKIMIDYGGLNVAKVMHVGHLRSLIIGESIKRIAKFLGHDVVCDIHLGDWGKPLGLLIGEMEIAYPNTDLNTVPFTINDFQTYYPIASAKAKTDETFNAYCMTITSKIQNKDPYYTKLWKTIIDLSVEDIKKEIESLNVEFDLWNGESAVEELIDPMIDMLESKGLVYQKDDLKLISVQQDTDKHEIPPFLLKKSDGSSLYSTTDLATILDRINTYDNLDKILYVVDDRQTLHFEQVFRVAKKSGICSDNVELTHISFGTVNGPDGKPLKTRDGNLMNLHDLIALAYEKAHTRFSEIHKDDEFSNEEKHDIVKKIATAAIKFADLKVHRTTNYNFDIDSFVQFEGQTGPFILYSAVRIKSILNKINYDNKQHPLLITSDEEKQLALTILLFNDYLVSAFDKAEPNLICLYAYKLAKDFNDFYQNCPIVSETNVDIQNSRLYFASITLKLFENITHILGFDIPNKM